MGVARTAGRAAYDIRHGRLERSLSLMTAAGSAVTAAEIFLEHDRAGFGNRLHGPALAGDVPQRGDHIAVEIRLELVGLAEQQFEPFELHQPSMIMQLKRQ